MNKRFETLAEEAMVHVPGQTGLHTRAFSLKKFAELIVKECAEVARLNTRKDSKVYLMVKEHFGVKE